MGFHSKFENGNYKTQTPMRNKTVILPSNKKALQILKELQEKKAKLQHHFSKKGKVGTINLKQY